MTKEEQPRESEQKPIAMVSSALHAAARNQPYFERHGDSAAFRSQLITHLGLASDEPDNLGLIERFTGRRSIGVLLGLRGIVRLEKGIDTLLEAGLDNTSTEYQMMLGRDLTAVAARQYQREGHVCPGVLDMVINAPESYLTEVPRLKGEVFSEEFAHRVHKKHGNISDASIAAFGVLRNLGFSAPAQADRLDQIGQVYLKPPDEDFFALSPTRRDNVPEKVRIQLLKGSLRNLEDFWILRFGQTEPHPLIPPTKRSQR